MVAALETENEVMVKGNGEAGKTTLMSSKKRPQLPILPQYPVPAGALVVDQEDKRVVYLAPLMSTSNEIYLAKHKELLKGNRKLPSSSEDQQGQAESKKLMLASLERHLARAQKPMQPLGSLNQQSSSSAFDIPSSDGLNRCSIPIVTTTETAVADDQLKKMKQRVKLLPISDDDHTTFWETIRGYERMRANFQRIVLAGGASSPMGFNMEAAFKKMAWIELETHLVDAAIEEHEGKNFEFDAQTNSPKAKLGSRKKREVWMSFVPESFRTPVILELLKKDEKEYREKFRRQEVDFFPQLVQTLRDAVKLTQQLATANPSEPVNSDERQTPVMIPTQTFGLVAVSYNFKNLPALSEKTRDVAMSLFESLVGQHFNHFSSRSKLLLNPSVIEFQDTMKELKKICSEEPDSSFFMCLSTHGARVTRGANEGSYVLFSETRLSSEEELVLTAIHERELAQMINDIPCKNKFVALELCQIQEPKDKIIDDAETIRHRIHEQLISQLYKQIVQLRLQGLQEPGKRLSSNKEISEETERVNPKLLNFIMMESCNVKTEVPVRANEERNRQPHH
ncbi:uncharacterized protein PITG_03674 [Phytophthora infestans T30-4]|uniref:Uncharacterized protein n=1 Tax=Phytophthora infestans (strain T30-4) TaxID=403677 RepID=D0MY82_PHYIT|nr:uncharacterized protein PITG_03674 [Phytophthora infestans T30-4]EEY66130.1 hypothetical protein PITG_03674 [Phytophthora infestans T30-4]|eukprot:XP_002906729.1 hypothetical protein PITG_03674 [Phytophthora infestans T30-4]